MIIELSSFEFWMFYNISTKIIFCSALKFDFLVVSDIFYFFMHINIEKSEMIMTAYFDQIHQTLAWFSRTQFLLLAYY
jgi:hypothetical protein